MDPRRINPRGPPPGVCRLPDCDYPVFFDRRVNEHREWCSDQHMRCAFDLHNPVLSYLPLGMR
jgi:hypothetical protein